jgi:hypothetical protein
VVRDILPTDLHNKVVYDNWLRGEFGGPDAPQAKEFGRKLLDAQAWTWDDVRNGKDADNTTEQQKKDEYKRITTQLGPATGYFKGTDGSRIGAGFLAFLQAIVYSLFQLFAKLAVLLAQLLLRILTLTAPIIGLVALVHHDILRRVGKAVGAVVLNVLILAMLAGVHFKFLQLIFSADAKLSLLTQMLLAGIVTLVFLLVGRPMRRMWQMIEMSVGAAGAAMPAARGGLFSRFRGRKQGERTPQDDFWENIRDSELQETGGAEATPAGRRSRPEASNPIPATAERLDTRPAITAGGSRALPPARGALEAGTETVAPQRRAEHVMVRSRVVDTAPVTDRGWDRAEEGVLVPSRVGPGERAETLNPSPRPADIEEVGGRPVHVVYRPSRGLEVADNRQPRRMPLQDGPRYTDGVVEGVAR